MATYPELTGKSVLVTGAGRGIGLAIARRFITEGAQVLLTDIDAGESAQLIAAAGQQGTQAAFQNLDVTSANQTDEAISRALELYGCLDVIVCNAGIGEIAPLIEATEQSFDRQMSVNAKGCFLSATAAARQYRDWLRQHSGRLVSERGAIHRAGADA